MYKIEFIQITWENKTGHFNMVQTVVHVFRT